MDWLRLSAGLLLAISISSCSQEKTYETVFPDSSNDKSGSYNNCDISSRYENRFIVQWENGQITAAQSESEEDFRKDFVEPNLKDIRYIEYDARVYVDSEWSQKSENSNQTWGQNLIQVPEVFVEAVDGAGVIVAVIDSGVDVEHPQLLPRIAINEAEIPDNRIDDDGNGYIDDYYGYDFAQDSAYIYDVLGHGTHVAGIIAADHNFGPKIGVAPKAKIIPLNFMSSQGGGSISDAIRAIDYAVARGASIINASWGGSACSKLLQESIAKIGKAGVLFVAAAGNRGLNLSHYPEFPAAFVNLNQITVGASTDRDITAFFSNYSSDFVHLMAPGDEIYSTIPYGDYANMRGTSMAAPFVSGVAALLKSAFPKASAIEIKRAIMEGTDSGPFSVMSGGRLNAAKALDALRRNHRP